jgi:hypothetical protein
MDGVLRRFCQPVLHRHHIDLLPRQSNHAHVVFAVTAARALQRLTNTLLYVAAVGFAAVTTSHMGGTFILIAVRQHWQGLVARVTHQGTLCGVVVFHCLRHWRCTRTLDLVLCVPGLYTCALYSAVSCKLCSLSVLTYPDFGDNVDVMQSLTQCDPGVFSTRSGSQHTCSSCMHA